MERTLKRTTLFWFLLIGLAYVLLHLFTLSISPLPWFDEVYYASVSERLYTAGDFVPEIAKYARNHKEALSNGPVFFIVSGALQMVFGLSPFIIRLPGLLAGLGIILLVPKLTVHENFLKPTTLFLFAALFALDPFFNLCMHNGRMDVVATFFCLAGILSCIRNIGSQRLAPFFYAGLFLSIGLLTSLRSAILILPAIPIGLIYARWSIKQWLVLIFAIVAPYYIWVFIGFGGVSNWWTYYIDVNQGNSTAVHGFLGVNHYIPKHQWLIIFFTGIIFLAFIVQSGLKRLDALSAYSLLAIVLFHLLVYDWGYYSVIIIPCYYLLLFRLLIKLKLRLLNAGVLTILLLFNFSFILYKSADIIASRNLRKQTNIALFLQQNLPKESRLIGNPRFFYAARETGASYQLYDKYDNDSSRLKKLYADYGATHVIIGEGDLLRQGVLLSALKNVYNVDTIATFIHPSLDVLSGRFRWKTGRSAESEGYNCTLLRINGYNP